jgi:Helicase associated domain
MQTTLPTTLRGNGFMYNNASRQFPRHFKFMLQSPQCSIVSKLRKPFTSNVVYNNHKFALQTLLSCTATSQEATSEPTSTATATNNVQPTSPLYQPKFDAMYEQLSIWRAKYRTTIVPRNAHDAGDLGEWVAQIRRLHRRGTLPSWAIEKLNDLDMSWKVDVLTAKWHANFHTTREFKEVHGGENCDLDTALPPDWGTVKKKKDGGGDGEGGEEAEVAVSEEERAVRADFVEAARWLERQRELFIGEKLTDYRVWVLKRLLGKMKQQQHFFFFFLFFFSSAAGK